MAGCNGKRRHRSKTSAIAAAIRLSNNGHPLRVYHCPTCRDWHLTKQPRKDHPMTTTPEPGTNVQPLRSTAQLVQDLLALQDQINALGDRAASIKHQLAEQVGVGNTLTLDDAGGVTVTVRSPSRRFNPGKAVKLLAPEVLELCKNDGYDAKKLKSFLSPVLLEQVMDEGTGAPIVSVK